MNKAQQEAEALTERHIKRFLREFPNDKGYVDPGDEVNETASDKAFIAPESNGKKQKKKKKKMAFVNEDDEKEDHRENQDEEEEKEEEEEDDDDDHHHHEKKKKKKKQNLKKNMTKKQTLADIFARSQIYFDQIKNSSDESKKNEAKQK